MWYLKKGNYLTPVQYDFGKMRSTTYAVLSLGSSVYAAFAPTSCQSSLILKTYDTTRRHGVSLNLYEFGMHGN